MDTMASPTSVSKPNGSARKKTKTATRLTRNDKLVLKRAHVLPRGKKIKSPTKEVTNESNRQSVQK